MDQFRRITREENCELSKLPQVNHHIEQLNKKVQNKDGIEVRQAELWEKESREFFLNKAQPCYSKPAPSKYHPFLKEPSPELKRRQKRLKSLPVEVEGVTCSTLPSTHEERKKRNAEKNTFMEKLRNSQKKTETDEPDMSLW